MFSTSQDILNLTIALVVFSLGFLICLGIYYGVMIVRDLRQITKETRVKVTHFWQVIASLKSKLDQGRNATLFVTTTIIKLLEYLDQKTDNLKTPTTRKKKYHRKNKNKKSKPPSK